jgi:hypothetical protein
MDRIQQLVRICEALNCIVAELKYMNNMLDERDNYNTMEQIRRRRERSLASYRQQYERQHGVIEINSDGEDEIDHPIGVQPDTGLWL